MENHQLPTQSPSASLTIPVGEGNLSALPSSEGEGTCSALPSSEGGGRNANEGSSVSFTIPVGEGTLSALPSSEGEEKCSALPSLKGGGRNGYEGGDKVKDTCFLLSVVCPSLLLTSHPGEDVLKTDNFMKTEAGAHRPYRWWKDRSFCHSNMQVFGKCAKSWRLRLACASSEERNSEADRVNNSRQTSGRMGRALQEARRRHVAAVREARRAKTAAREEAYMRMTAARREQLQPRHRSHPPGKQNAP